MRSRLTSRAGVLALAGISSLAAASLAAPLDTPGIPSLAPLDRVNARGAPPPARPVASPRVEAVTASLARVAIEKVRDRPYFPIRAEFNWGQSGARFGAGRGGRAHAGQDVFARTGAPLVAVTDGVVVETGDDGGRGNYVALYDPRRRRTYVYLHMDRPSLVAQGRRVKGGTRLGGVGCTGSCFGDHLHFEVRAGRGPDGAPMDPLPLLRRWAAQDRLGATLPPGQH
jgi:murein DD-endopeptidase MepM/ murein hydrolase activator NlpD